MPDYTRTVVDLSTGEVRTEPLSVEEIALIETYVPPPPTPLIISPRQIRQALTALSLRSSVEAAVAAADQDVQDWWHYATQFEENHPMVVAMATQLGVSTDSLHNIFVLGASL